MYCTCYQVFFCHSLYVSPINSAAILCHREGWLGGAILDVFETEPLPPESPFWTMPEVIPHLPFILIAFPSVLCKVFISPHVSAVTMMEEVSS